MKHDCQMDSAARLVLRVLAVVLLLIVGSAIVAAFRDRQLPEKMWDIANACLMALVGMLAATRRNENGPGPQDVTIVDQKETIPVEEVKPTTVEKPETEHELRNLDDLPGGG